MFNVREIELTLVIDPLLAAIRGDLRKPRGAARDPAGPVNGEPLESAALLSSPTSSPTDLRSRSQFSIIISKYAFSSYKMHVVEGSRLQVFDRNTS